METTTVLVEVEYKIRLLCAKVKELGIAQVKQIFGRLKSLLTIKGEWECVVWLYTGWYTYVFQCTHCSEVWKFVSLKVVSLKAYEG